MQSSNQTQPEISFSAAELQQVLIEKQIEANNSQSALLKAQQENISLAARSLKVYEENAMYKASPELAAQFAEMEYYMKVAQKFIDSKAFKPMTPEQAYVIMKAGKEMGMKEVESMQSLYCVNGAVKFHGDKMVARITGRGYKIEYLGETESGVVVKCTHPDGFEASEKVTDKDQIIVNSKAAGFAKKNKMRFHGVRMIASFHLPHLFGSITDEFTSDFHEWEEVQPKGIDIARVETTKESKRVLDFINSARSIDELMKAQNGAKQYGFETEYLEKMANFQNAQNIATQ